MAKRGRPRRKAPVRTVSAQMLEADADQFLETCEALDTTQSEMIRQFVRRFNEENRAAWHAHKRREPRPNEPIIPAVDEGGRSTAA